MCIRDRLHPGHTRGNGNKASYNRNASSEKYRLPSLSVKPLKRIGDFILFKPQPPAPVSYTHLVRDKRIRKLDRIVKEVKQSEEWEAAKMNILEIGMEKGIQKGLEKGKLKGQEL